MIPTKDDPYYDVWPGMIPLERLVWMWVYRNQKALDRLVDVPKGNKFIVRLEDLGNKDILKSLENFVGVKARKRFVKRKVNKNNALNYSPPDAWTKEMNKRFKKITGDMMVN